MNERFLEGLKKGRNEVMKKNQVLCQEQINNTLISD